MVSSTVKINEQCKHYMDGKHKHQRICVDVAEAVS
jgi:hypothetical protein